MGWGVKNYNSQRCGQGALCFRGGGQEVPQVEFEVELTGADLPEGPEVVIPDDRGAPGGE